MAYKKTKNGEIVIYGGEKGIAPSPHKGIANIQNGNISTETGEIMCSFGRVQQSQTNTNAIGTFTFVDTSHLSASISLTKGIWVTVSNSSHTGELPNGVYYILITNGAGFVLATTYNGSGLTGYTAGLTANFNLIRNIGQPIASATETYNASGGSVFYRYYILDSNGLVWVYDTIYDFTVNVSTWFLPDSSIATTTGATGIAVLNGWLHIFVGTAIYAKPTVNLGDSSSTSSNWVSFASGQMLTTQNHFALVGHQGKLYYTDGNFIGSIFPNTSLLTLTTANIQSYASYTTSTTTGTISTLIGGSLPYNGTDNSQRIPAVFFHALTTGASNPAAVTIGTIYYIQYNSPTNGNFEVYAAATGGSALDITTGAVGVQYFSTYYPTSAGGKTTITFTPERVNLPFFETSTSLAEVGNNVIIGTKSNILYPWNQVDPLPSDLIPLPENMTVNMITVNNMVYVFAGNKGNIYITNGSTASLVIGVPDYCAGIAGTPASYIEPYFVWGGAMYLRGRVYFSIQDQTATKAGNCGGVWSFVPTQNFFIGEDTGLSLRLENQASYATYNGMSPVLLASQTQSAIAPQYWNGWLSSISGPTYGIDFTGTTPLNPCLIETDLVPTGTMLEKNTFEQIEYKLSAPLVAGESVSLKYRQNSTDAFVSCGTVIVESTTSLSGYVKPNFQNGQWLQLQISLNPLSSASASFIRLSEVIVRSK